MTDIFKKIRPLVVTFVLLAILTGVIYPLVIFIIGHLVFPFQANGSLLKDKNGTLVGSQLIGQQFTEDQYFWGRPSYTSGFPYNPLASAGSNYGPTNEKLIKDITNQTSLIKQANGVYSVPTDLVMGSASGLDPDISLDAAFLQVPRVANARGLDQAIVVKIVNDHARKPFLGIMGENTVNVLSLNLALDQMK